MRKEREFESSLVSSYEDFTPNGLRKLALDMESANITSIMFTSEDDYGGGHKFVCKETRLETDAEQRTRETQERIDNQRREEWERAQWLQLKAKYGITGQ